MKPEFYVGYLPQAPPRTGAFVRRVVLGLLALGAALGLGLALSQDPFPPKVFEWGNPRTLVGWVEPGPVPRLAVRRPGAIRAESAWSSYARVGVGKHGAEIGSVRGWVEATGTLIYRDGQTMLELEPGGLNPLQRDDAGPGGDSDDLGQHTLIGEIVDSKCFLGVMAPGSTKPHRACATRCISGGIPPVLLVRDAGGRAVYLYLEGPGGRALHRDVLEFVAEPVEVSGQVLRDGPTLRLVANPTQIRRLEP